MAELPHPSPLEGHDGIPPHERHSPRDATARPQEHQEHADLHTALTFENDDYICKAAASVKEATELIEAGFEYVCDVTSVKLFRKPK